MRVFYCQNQMINLEYIWKIEKLFPYKIKKLNPSVRVFAGANYHRLKIKTIYNQETELYFENKKDMKNTFDDIVKELKKTKLNMQIIKK